MDTSPEYVKMCEKATEIQEGWMPALGDWHSSITEDGTSYTSPICLVGGIITGFYRNDIWLPRQDQLIDMVGKYGHFKPFINALIGFQEWFDVERRTYCECNSYEQMETKYASFEQLWLAYVMHETTERNGREQNGRLHS